MNGTTGGEVVEGPPVRGSSGTSRGNPSESLSALQITAVQLMNIVLLGRMFSLQGFRSLDFFLAIVIVGEGSAFSIITAYELIHRRRRWEQWLGRLLMCSVLYEHFYTGHLRGHHVRVGYADDPATARFGETFAQFYFRTLPAQFKNAWRLEKRRLCNQSEVPRRSPQVQGSTWSSRNAVTRT